MTKIAILTDAHANLPALQAARSAIRHEGYDAIYHTGDAIGIGPQPAECLDLLLNTPGMRCVMGNHDSYFAHGLPQPQPEWMSDGEVQHQQWTHAQLDPAWRTEIEAWPYVIEERFGNLRVFYGHDHVASDLTGQVRYVNPGALGCHTEPAARFVMLEVKADGTYTLQKHAVPYDDAPLFRAFEERCVPERTDLYRAFFGGRFKTND